MHEQRVFAAGQKFVDNPIETLLALVVHLTNRASQAARNRRRRHQRIERGLAGAAFNHPLDVVDEDIFGLRREVEDHIHVKRGEVWARLAHALQYLLATAILVVTIHLLEQTVVETLHAYAQALHTTLQLVQIRRNQMVRIRFAGNLFDGECFARQVNRIA